MTRVKKGVNALKTRRNVLRRVKGFRLGRGTKERQAIDAILHAGVYSFAHRKDKKGEARRIWNVNISYALKEMGTSYSKVMGQLKKNGVLLDRKILSTLVKESPETFKKVVNLAMTVDKGASANTYAPGNPEATPKAKPSTAVTA